LIVAVAGVEDVQTATAVMSWSDESLNVPVAVYCFVVPTAMLELAVVVTAIETSVAAETVSEAVPLTDPEAAVIVDVPVPTPVATPLRSIWAAEVEDELQVTDCSSCVLPSSKLPTAVNSCVVPAAIV